MNHRNSNAVIRLASTALLAALLAACTKAEPAPAEPAATPAPATEAPAETPTPPDATPPAESPAAPAQPAPEAPPPTDPSPTAKPTAASIEPALESMQSAQAPSKLSVPVDLRYSFDAEPLANQPVTLHLAAVPRVAGINLVVSVKNVQGIQVAAGGPLNVQKASANGAYRQQFSVTRQAASPKDLRVLVTMDLPEGSAFGFFSVPFDPGTNSQKLESVKQR